MLIDNEVMIYTSNHDMRRDRTIISQGLDINSVHIEDDVWIGA